jgi:3-carboxy-cis,cis-muconate cycloisomerase
VERRAAGKERNRVLRFLSLELIFADERCAQALSDEQYLAAMARFEAALARAGAEAGLFAGAHAEVIARVCSQTAFDAGQLARDARLAGTLAIPFVKALTAQVAGVSAEAARYVHFGATSQDVIDSAAALCLLRASERIDALAVALGDAAAALARTHGNTATVARTLLQPAAPVPFGWKAAMWLAPLARSVPHFRHAVREACVLQLGGAAGTLAAFAQRGASVRAAMARGLALHEAPTWHSARDAFARLGAEMAVLTGLAAKVGRDVSLLMQPEIAELSEPAGAGRGGSSSMPHKRNPSGCLLALEAATRAPALAATLLGELAPEHERGIGQWQGQWFTLRQLALAASSALAAMAEVTSALQVDTRAMRANLERSNGLVFSEALSLALSRPVADRLVAQAVSEGRGLREVARGTLDEAALQALFDPQQAFGSAGAMSEQVLADWASARESALSGPRESPRP